MTRLHIYSADINSDVKILIEVPQEPADQLNLLAIQSGKPHATIILEALTEYQAKHRNDMSRFYGLLAVGDETPDAQAYLDTIWSEWDR